MRIEEMQNLIGKKVIYDDKVREITGMHLYINAKGIQSARLHLQNVDGYIKLEDAQFFEIIKIGDLL